MSGTIARGTIRSVEDEPLHVVVWMVRDGREDAEAFPIHKTGATADVALGQRALTLQLPCEATLSYLGGGSAELRQVTGLTLS